MRQQSASSITTYLKCPHAYELKYVFCLTPETTEEMEYGRWLNDEILKPDCDEKAKPYREALLQWLAENDDEVIDQEVKIEFGFNGYTFLGYLDFLTKKRRAIEMKVTGNPGYYQNFISYQLEIYELGFLTLNHPYWGIYLLFEKDKRKGKEGDFRKLHQCNNAITPLMKNETIDHLTFICQQIEKSYQQHIFVPTYNECHKCLMKKHCNYYWGF